MSTDKRQRIIPAHPTIEYRVTLPDGRELTERVIGLSQIAALYPQAVRVERVSAGGGFY